MKLAAITGSIGCGKTTLSHMIRRMGYCVYDVDGWVRSLYDKPDFVELVVSLFPEVLEDGKFNKRRLRNLVFNDNQKLKELESLIHPFLRKKLKNVIHKHSRVDALFFLDVALLFEMGWDSFCDCIILADVDYEIQKQRVMNRDNISAEDFDKINDIQMSNRDKAELSDIVIDTDATPNLLEAQLREIINGLENSW